MIHRICVQFIWRLVLMLCFLELFATSINGTENSRKRHLDNYQENPRSQKRQRLNGPLTTEDGDKVAEQLQKHRTKANAKNENDRISELDEIERIIEQPNG
eukprot:913130_1